MAATETARPASVSNKQAKGGDMAQTKPFEDVVRTLAALRHEPGWLLQLRLLGLRHLLDAPSRPRPAVFSRAGSLDDVSGSVRRFLERGQGRRPAARSAEGAQGTGDLGADVHARKRIELESQGVVFCDLDRAVIEHPDIVRSHLGTVVPPDDGVFAALNVAFFTGGSFIHVPEGVKVDVPLQTFLGIAAEARGPFERTLVVVDEGAEVDYLEGCSAPVYSVDALHTTVVEVIASQGSSVSYTTIQNWSRNVCSVAIKRAVAETEAQVRWVDGNIGSEWSRTCPSVYLRGPKASGEALSITYAGAGQAEDSGANMVHCAPETTSNVVAKSISKDGGRTAFRARVQLRSEARDASSKVRSEVLVLDEDSVSVTTPEFDVPSNFDTGEVRIDHDSITTGISRSEIFYLMSRGLSESQATSLIVNGFIEPVISALPLEYAVEWTRLVEMQMDNSVG